MSKQWIVAAIVTLLLTGCTGGRFISAEPGERLTVTTGYDLEAPLLPKGDEFVFSFVPPMGSDWNYRERRWVLFGQYEPINDRGYITVYGDSDFFNSIRVIWRWVNETTVRVTFEGRPTGWARMPWYRDIVYEPGAHVPYIPKEHEIQGRDWYRLGYPQMLFTDYMTKGPQEFQCRRSVLTRSGTADWNEDEQVVTVRAENTTFYVNYHCPFRLIDGRSADFYVRTGVWISGEELAANPNALEEQLDAVDRWLEPTWQSLVIREDAYQFDPPEGAQQSIFCETDGYCW